MFVMSCIKYNLIRVLTLKNYQLELLDFFQTIHTTMSLKTIYNFCQYKINPVGAVCPV